VGRAAFLGPLGKQINNKKQRRRRKKKVLSSVFEEGTVVEEYQVENI
jgi:hypothetical protein